MRKLMAVIAAAGIALAGCGVTDSQVVDNNIREQADNFKIMRSVVFINTRDNSYLLQVIGFCNINDQTVQIETICKRDGKFEKHMMGLQSEDVTYVVQQLDLANVSDKFFYISIKPTSLLPLADIR